MSKAVVDAVKKHLDELDSRLSELGKDADEFVQKQIARLQKNSKEHWESVAEAVAHGGSEDGKVRNEYPKED